MILLFFSGIWKGGCLQVKVKASGVEKTVYGGRKRCENHLGVKEEGGSKLKNICVLYYSRRSGHRVSGTRKLSLRLQDRALCF